MGQCTHGDEVDTLLGIVANGIERDATRRLCLVATCDDIDSLLRIGHAEVVEHDTIDATMIQYLLKLVERTDLNLNLQVEALLLQVCVTAVDSINDATSKVDVVILEQNHVEETYAMVAATTNLHSLLLQHTQAWCGLTRVEYTGLGTLQALYVLVSHRGNTTHALHNVQHQTLCLQQRARLTRHNHSDVALLHTGTILHQHLDLHRRIETMEHLLGNLDACQDTIFLDEQMRLTHGILRNTTQRGVVTIANILGKRQVNQLVNQFFDIHVVVWPVEINTQHKLTFLTIHYSLFTIH